MFAADNNEIDEETLDGKQTTHATTLVVYKKDNLVQHLYGMYMQTIRNEKADKILLLHAKHAASDFTRIVIQSPDTDVLVFMLFSILVAWLRRIVVPL